MENLPSHVTRIQLPISEAANFEALRKRTESVSLQAINHKLLKKVDPYQEFGVSDQKSANLCMAQSAAMLLKHAFEEKIAKSGSRNMSSRDVRIDLIIFSLTMDLIPIGMTGINPNTLDESENVQQLEIMRVLKRLTNESFFEPEGWKMIAKKLYLSKKHKDLFGEPIDDHKLTFEKVLLNENFVFTRPVIVTVAHWLPERKKVFFFQSVLERIEDDNFVLANNAFVKGSEEIHIPVKSPYYNWDSRAMRKMIQKHKSSLYEDNNIRLYFVNEKEKPKEGIDVPEMEPERYYLLSAAFSLQFV